MKKIIALQIIILLISISIFGILNSKLTQINNEFSYKQYLEDEKAKFYNVNPDTINTTAKTGSLLIILMITLLILIIENIFLLKTFRKNEN